MTKDESWRPLFEKFYRQGAKARRNKSWRLGGWCFSCLIKTRLLTHPRVGRFRPTVCHPVRGE